MPVKSCGWYFLVSMPDDLSRCILAWLLQKTIDSDAFSGVIELAREAAGLDQGPIRKRTNLWTEGKIEHHHRSINKTIKAVVWGMPGGLNRQTAGFADGDHSNRYHEALGNLKPDDVCLGGRGSGLQKRTNLKERTLAGRCLDKANRA